jgi:hypothetical protein
MAKSLPCRRISKTHAILTASLDLVNKLLSILVIVNFCVQILASALGELCSFLQLQLCWEITASLTFSR